MARERDLTPQVKDPLPEQCKIIVQVCDAATQVQEPTIQVYYLDE